MEDFKSLNDLKLEDGILDKHNYIKCKCIVTNQPVFFDFVKDIIIKIQYLIM